jgi:hypothetical protein
MENNPGNDAKKCQQAFMALLPEMKSILRDV